MAVIELRRIAEQAPDIAVELRHTAQKLEAEAEAEDLACLTLSKYLSTLKTSPMG